MVKVVINDIFESKAQTLVNEVDCVGRMAKGIALEFKQRFPDVYIDYLRRRKTKQVKLGQPYLYLRVLPPWILNFPTKENSRSAARLEDIVRARPTRGDSKGRQPRVYVNDVDVFFLSV